MDTQLTHLLRKRGIDPDLEFSRLHPHARRADGWSALDVYKDEVRQRKDFFDELGRLRMMPAQDEQHISMLDFGSGLASNCIALAECICLAVALDASYDHCVSAVECIRAEGLGNVGVFQGSLLPSPRHATIPLRARSFDMIVSYHGCWRRDIPLLLPDWCGLLKPGGCIYLVYPRFWFEDSSLTADEAELGSAVQHSCGWPEVDLPLIRTLAGLAGTKEVYHGTLQSLAPVNATGIIYLSTGIVSSREEFASLIGDFDRRWRVRQRLMVLQAA